MELRGALFLDDPAATLDDLREAVTTLEDTALRTDRAARFWWHASAHRGSLGASCEHLLEPRVPATELPPIKKRRRHTAMTYPRMRKTTHLPALGKRKNSASRRAHSPGFRLPGSRENVRHAAATHHGVFAPGSATGLLWSIFSLASCHLVAPRDTCIVP